MDFNKFSHKVSWSIQSFEIRGSKSVPKFRSTRKLGNQVCLPLLLHFEDGHADPLLTESIPLNPLRQQHKITVSDIIIGNQTGDQTRNSAL